MIRNMLMRQKAAKIKKFQRVGVVTYCTYTNDNGVYDLSNPLSMSSSFINLPTFFSSTCRKYIEFFPLWTQS